MGGQEAVLNVGDTIHLHFFDQNEIHKYRAKVIDITPDAYFIGLPVNEETNRTDIFLTGESCEAQFVTKEQSMYAFQTKIIGRKKSNIPMIMLKRPGKNNYSRIQRRAYVRVNYQTEIVIQSCENDSPPYTTVTLDISGGGIGILYKDHHKLKEHETVQCWLSLPMQSGKNIPIQELCKVARIQNEDTACKVSLEFVEINDANRENIVRFCFERQLDERRKGLE